MKDIVSFLLEFDNEENYHKDNNSQFSIPNLNECSLKDFFGKEHWVKLIVVNIDFQKKKIKYYLWN